MNGFCKKKEEDAIKDRNMVYLAFKTQYFDILSIQDVFFFLKELSWLFKVALNTNHDSTLPYTSNKTFPHLSKIFFLIPHPQCLKLGTEPKMHYSSRPFQNSICGHPKTLKRAEHTVRAHWGSSFPLWWGDRAHSVKSQMPMCKSLAVGTMSARRRRWQLAWAFSRAIENQQWKNMCALLISPQEKYQPKRNRGRRTENSAEKEWAGR